MADMNVIYRIAADISGLKTGVEQAAAATTGLETKFENLGKAIGAAFSVQHIRQVVNETTLAFSEQEAASGRLLTALKAQGTFAPELAAQYANLATQFQNTTVFSDDLITSMQALLVQVGGVMPEQMGLALTAATNLAAGLDIDLRTATMAVAKAFEEGGTAALTRLLPGLKGIVTEGAPVATILEEINTKFGPQAAAQMDTYAGKTAALGNTMNDVEEKIGSLVADALTPMLNLFMALPGPVQTVIGGMYTLIPSLEGVALAVLAIGGPGKALALLTTAFGGLATFLTTTLVVAFDVVVGLFTGLVGLIGAPAVGVIAVIGAVVLAWKNWDTIGPIVQRVYTAVKTWLVDRFAAVVQMIRDKVAAVSGFFKDMYDKVVGHSYVPDMLNGIAREFGRLGSVMVEPTRRATMGVTDQFQTMFSNLSGMISDKMPKLFGGSGLMASIMNSGLSLIFGPSGILMSLVMQGMSRLADLVWSGIKKIGGWFKGLFGFGGEPGGAPFAPDPVTGEPDNVMPVDRDPFVDFDDQFDNFASGSGGVRDFGSGTLAMLHGREAVIPENQMASGGHSAALLSVVSEIRDAMMSGARVSVQVDGRELVRSSIRTLDSGSDGLTTQFREVLGVA